MRELAAFFAIVGAIGSIVFGWLQAQPQLCGFALPRPICLSTHDQEHGEGRETPPPEPYALSQLTAQVREAVASAREARASARSAAMRARAAAARAHSAARRALQGDPRFQLVARQPEWRGERLTGGHILFGVLQDVSATAAGEFHLVRDGARTRLLPAFHTYESAEGRFEGAATGEDWRWQGPGQYVFRNGDRFEGVWNPQNGRAGGVWTYASGQRYEGEFEDLDQSGFDLRRDGFGVLWSADGRVLQAGVWRNGEFTRSIVH